MNPEFTSAPELSTEKSMLDACRSGDLPMLHQLLTSNQQPSNDEFTNSREFRTTLHELLEVAATYRQVAIIKYLLETYRIISLSQQFTLVQAILDNPDAEIVTALCIYDPNFSNFNIDYFRCIITEACSRPPARIGPVLHVLMDYGADLNDGYGPGGGALYAAILGDQPKEIVEKMVEKGAIVSFRVVYLAVEKRRVDVLDGLLRSSGDNVKSEELFEKAKSTGDKEIIKMVGKFLKRRMGKDKWWKVWKSK